MRNLLLVIMTVALATPQLAAATPPLERRVDAYLAPLLAERKFSGEVLIARGDHVLLDKGYGLASVELGAPNAPGRKFQVGSVSKPLTAAVVMKLVERGRIVLSDPLSKYVPEYPAGRDITIEQLLTHTSGVPDVNGLPIYKSLGLQHRTPAEIVAAFKDAPLAFPPGSSYAYSNSNYVLLALIIERVTGEAYGEAMQRELFDPLGMRDSGHRGDDSAVIPNMTSGYVRSKAGTLARPAWFDWSVKTGNGSIYSTGQDLFRFVRGYFGGRVIGSRLVDLATTPKSVPPRAPGFEWLSRDIGYGWMLDRNLGRRRVFHIGRSPGYNAALAYYPDDQLTVVVLSNIYVDATLPASEAFAGMVLGAPSQAH
ncbi:serine hydrolase domain-containing protein [Phenylobacterium sp.]|jgi:CubicO group peptidase (beta-lactamase class C family)|uniref:serine hydrolase domain-containing protein n=1 Tax=Phenylobacterium sp. TaxID=1871053 RepID=UPI002F40B715